MEQRVSDERCREIERESLREGFGGRLFGEAAGPTAEEVGAICRDLLAARGAEASALEGRVAALRDLVKRLANKMATPAHVFSCGVYNRSGMQGDCTCPGSDVSVKVRILPYAVDTDHYQWSGYQLVDAVSDEQLCLIENRDRAMWLMDLIALYGSTLYTKDAPTAPEGT